MTDIIGILFEFGIPIAAASIGTLVFVGAIALGIANGRFLVLGFVIIIFAFVNPSYGLVEAPAFNIYAKGGKTFLLPFIQYGFYALFIAVWTSNAFEARKPLRDAGGGWLIALGILFIAHLIAGVVLEDLSPLHIVAPRGIIHILHIGMAAYLVSSSIRTEKDLKYVVRLIIILVFCRGVFALVRFAVFGGDPQNAYANLEGGNIALKITFWDSNEGVLASMAAFYAAWQIFRCWAGKVEGKTLFFVVMLIVELLVVILSFRRSNWVALLLVTIYFLSFLPPSRRWVVGLLGVSLLLPAIWLGANKRFEASALDRNRSIIEVLAPDARGFAPTDRKKSRFYELDRAWATLAKSPVTIIFGIGSWGSFDPGNDALALAYHAGRYDFVHSGFGHVLLKSGLLGLAIFLGFGSSILKRSAVPIDQMDTKFSVIHFTFRAGMVAMIPTLVSGTPIPELRTTWMLGIILGVPLAIRALGLKKNVEPLGQPSFTSPMYPKRNFL
ncbi:MAG: hypothetical protein CRU78_15045 [Candidatus Accumulibacter phosphatis]|uniref:O-antigen ligase-related domain-containing protein n=1 Tax=Candidatus Accumulibacter phosphatis TaxID=327160 RepID=A0A6A7RW18_9PROT|nr:hypothetical protein [Candidatus Accumulibacter phosphatis]